MAQRVAIVTGAGSGIGQAAAEHLARTNDYRVVVVDRTVPAGQAVAESIRGCFIEADLCAASDCRWVVEETVASFGTVHVLVNNAGFQHVAPLDEFPEDVWGSMLATML